MDEKLEIAKEIVRLMSYCGSFPGLWKDDKPMTAEEVIAFVEKNHYLPMLHGHTKNNLEMQNTRHKISRRVVKVYK